MLTRRYTHTDDEQWAPVSDLMAVIMLIFMLITMLLFVSFDLEKKSNMEKCDETRSMLDAQFREDFVSWGAKLEEDLTIRFTNQRVLFGVDAANITPGGWFANMLNDFFPRYMTVIEDIGEQFGEKEVLAIRIEGHTSREYKNPGKEDPYIKNMELSQNRAREILRYVLNPDNIIQSSKYNKVARRLITANGLSSSRLICTTDGKEDKEASRRVEFKLLTNSCQKAGIYEKSESLISQCSETEIYDGF